jgi:hypothetical protein
MERNVKQLQTSYQERRRAAALEKQKNARKQLTDRARKLALDTADGEESQEGSQQVIAHPACISASSGPQLRAAVGCRPASRLLVPFLRHQPLSL